MLVPFLAIFGIAIGLAALVGLIRNYAFLYKHKRNGAFFLITASLLSLFIPDPLLKGLGFVMFSCVMMFINSTIRQKQSDN